MTKDNNEFPHKSGITLINGGANENALSSTATTTYFASLEFNKPKVSFEELFLSEEQRAFFSSIVLGYRNTDKLAQVGLSPIMRILLVGEPGTGRTAACCALAAELDMSLAFIRAEYIASMPEAEAMRRFSKDLEQVSRKAEKAPHGILLVIENLETVLGRHKSADTSPLMCHIVHTLKELPVGILLAATAGSKFSVEGTLSHVFESVICMEPPVLSQRLGIIKSLAEHWHLPPIINPELLAKFTDGICYGELINIMTEAARHHAISDDLTNADVTALILRRRLKYTSSPEKAVGVVAEMLDRGLSLRAAASALGMPHSTLDYQVQKYRASLAEPLEL